MRNDWWIVGFIVAVTFTGGTPFAAGQSGSQYPCTCAFLLGFPVGVDNSGSPVFPPGAPTWHNERGRSWTWSLSKPNGIKIVPEVNTWRSIGLEHRFQSGISTGVTPFTWWNRFVFGFKPSVARALYDDGCRFKYRITVKDPAGNIVLQRTNSDPVGSRRGAGGYGPYQFPLSGIGIGNLQGDFPDGSPAPGAIHGSICVEVLVQGMGSSAYEPCPGYNSIQFGWR